MKTRGAGEIGKQAAAALSSAAQGFTGTSMEAFRAEMLEAAKLLANARPTAVSLRNGLNFVLDAAMTAKTIDEAKTKTQARAKDFADRVTTAKAKIASEGAKLIPNRATILTHCNSSAASQMVHPATARPVSYPQPDRAST
jgi:ribose 1,5-bisphosphate isomerase